MFKNKGVEIVFASPPEYERLVAKIYYDGKLFAIVSEERAPRVFEIETPGPNLIEERIVRKIPWEELSRAVDEACEGLRPRDDKKSAADED